MDAFGTSQRRTYKKSFAGCRECKIRKVKCDEVRPICGHCARHFKNPKPCTWSRSPGASSSLPSRPRLSPHRSPSNISPPNNIPRSLSPKNTSPLGATKLTFPLRLFHHYTTTLVSELPHSHKPACRAAWKYDVAQLCFEGTYDFLLNIVLAISAVHIYHTRAPGNTDLLLAGRIYFDKGLTSFQNALAHNINEENAGAIMLTAGLLPPLGETFVDRHGDGYEPPLFRFHLAKAIRALFERTEPWVKGTNLEAFLTPYGQDTQRHPRYIYLQPSEKTNLMGLLDGLEPESPNYEAYKGALAFAVNTQEAAARGVTQVELVKLWTYFNLGMSDEFMALLEQHDPRAFVIWAHHLAMAKFVDVWWNRDTAEYNVPGLASLVSDEWQGRMQWPLYITNRKEKPQVVQSIPMLRLEDIATGDIG